MSVCANENEHIGQEQKQQVKWINIDPVISLGLNPSGTGLEFVPIAGSGT